MHDERRRHSGRPDAGFTLVEILMAIVLVGILSAVVVVGIGNLTRSGSSSACAASLDAAKAGSNVYYTGSNAFPTTMLQMTSANPPSLQLSSGVNLDSTGRRATGSGWTLTMTPGVGAAAPTFACASADAVVTSTTMAPNGTTACPGTYVAWIGEYYATRNMATTPALCRDDAGLAFDWAYSGPGGSMPSTNFAVRWTRTIPFTDGAHTFTLNTDDGSRLYVDGVLVLDWWSDHAGAVRTVSVTLSAGDHVVVLEYYQASGYANASLSMT